MLSRARIRPVLVLLLLAGAVAAAVRFDLFRWAGRLARPRPAHEAYAASLREAGLGDTALGRRWLEAAGRALSDAPAVSLPARETGYLPADDPRAVAWRVEVRRGQRLEAEVTVEGGDAPRVFVDLFVDSGGEPRHVQESAPGGVGEEVEPVRRLQREAGDDVTWLLRLQPELLRSVRYTVTLRAAPSLAFPVDGRDARAVGSVFGDPRDGGRREHHGIDVFAPAGTPALAAAAGEVARVDVTDIGGRVVWIRDAGRGLSLYYAHLESQAVRPGQRVARGDVVGHVGNTGNARGTAPHLHFGIYRRSGPVDPLPYVRQPPQRPPDVARAEWVGERRRLGRPAELAHGPEAVPAESAPAPLPAHTLVAVLGAGGDALRVVLPDGRSGLLPARALEPLAVLRRERRPGVALRDAPHGTAPTIARLDGPASLAVLARSNAWRFVETPDGVRGWIEG